MTIYSDINSFTPKKRVLFEDILAIYQNVQNILDTEKGERFFNVDLGIVGKTSLFDLSDSLTVRTILNDSINAIETYEPRVTVNRGASKVVPDTDNHKVDILVVFSIEGFEDQQFSATKTLG